MPHNEGGGGPLPRNVPHPFEPTAWVVPPQTAWHGAQELPRPRDMRADSGDRGRETTAGTPCQIESDLTFRWRSPGAPA